MSWIGDLITNGMFYLTGVLEDLIPIIEIGLEG